MVPLEIERDGKTLTNAVIERVEQKVGHHGSATCALRYDNSEAQLIAKAGDGFKLMVKLMNHARLGVGFESIGACEASYRCAKEYAAERSTMGQTIDQHPMIADYLDEMDVTIRGLRALAMEAAFAEEQVAHLELQQAALGRENVNSVEAERELNILKDKARHYTPLLKYTASEQAVHMARMAMQILGGNGYTKDYAPERILRDSLVLPVYEGTSQIQALMALKDNLSAITKNPQKFFGKIASCKFNEIRADDDLERRSFKLQSLSYSAQQHLLWRMAKDKWAVALAGPWGEVFESFATKWDPKRDMTYGLLHAENLCRILSDVAMAKLLVRQAQEFPERRDIAERFMERAEPRVRYHWDLIHSTGDRLLKRLADAREAEGVTQKTA